MDARGASSQEVPIMLTPQHRPVRQRMLLAIAGVVAAAALVVPPSADALGRTAPTVQSPTSGSRIDKACNRIPSVRERVQSKITLLQAGAETKGSIAWLQAKADTAATKGKSALADALRAKAAVRQATLTLLTKKLAALDKAAAACAARGIGA